MFGDASYFRNDLSTVPEVWQFVTFALMNMRQGRGNMAERKAQNDLLVVLLFLALRYSYAP